MQNSNHDLANLNDSKHVNFFKTKLFVFDEIDKQVWNLATTVPLLSKPLAFFCATLNIFIPGLGTLVAACGSRGSTVSKTQLVISAM